MSIIIPYNDNIEKTNGVFIKPNGEIVYIGENHESFAFYYCCKSNKLKKENLLLFKQWLMSQKNISNGMFSDFLTLVIGFDKADTIIKKSITTTDSSPYSKYYNYYLMDWYIDCQNRLVYNEEKKEFEVQNNEEFEYGRYIDMDVKEEIEDIKKNVLIKDRSVFFK